MPGRAIVLNATNRQSLVAIRSLGRRGISVTAGGYCRGAAAHLSKYADRRITYPTPWERPEAFVDTLVEEVRTIDYDALLISGETSIEAVVSNRERLADHVGLPYPPSETLQVALDKGQTIEAAEMTGIPHPETLRMDDANADAVEATLSYPVVVKPRKSHGRNGVVICHSVTELREALNHVQQTYGSALVQEYIPNGGEVGVYTMYDLDSTCRAVTVQERVRSFPPEGGASTCRHTVADPELIGYADDLLSSLDWQGVAMVEFRTDPRDGTPKLMEINPRLWGSLALSVAAGVDFPYLLYQLGANGECDNVPSYFAGVYARRLVGELAHVLSRQDRISAVQEVFQPTGGPCEFDILSLDDPLPIIGHLMESGRGLRNKLSDVR